MLTLFVGAETYARLVMTADGKMVWGGGAGAGDTTLYRLTADILKTDDMFRVGNLPGFVAGDKYVTCDSDGTLHRSSLGPAS